MEIVVLSVGIVLLILGKYLSNLTKKHERMYLFLIFSQAAVVFGKAMDNMLLQSVFALSAAVFIIISFKNGISIIKERL